LVYLVQSSSQGMTHEELTSLLSVRVHNPLLELTREGLLRRERIGPTFVYLHAKRTRETEQRRRRKAAMPRRPAVHPTPRQTIATLLELIQDPQATRTEIVRRCRRDGVAISPQVVDAAASTESDWGSVRSAIWHASSRPTSRWFINRA
jgi:hypothetical protein